MKNLKPSQPSKNPNLALIHKKLNFKQFVKNPNLDLFEFSPKPTYVLPPPCAPSITCHHCMLPLHHHQTILSTALLYCCALLLTLATTTLSSDSAVTYVW